MVNPQSVPAEPAFTALPPRVVNAAGRSRVVLVCEHASNNVPPELHGLGMSDEGLRSHAAWDPGAVAVAEEMSATLDAVLVASQVSRLVYDCNRPPEAHDAMVARSEVFDIPGNAGLDSRSRQDRIELVYRPFQAQLTQVLASRMDRHPVLVTVHSFTRVYNGVTRDVELGILCDRDARLADAMLARAADFTAMDVRKNQPYGPEHGVTHTLIEHGLANNIANVMIEIRNDLIASQDQQRDMARMLAGMVSAGIDAVSAPGAKGG